MSEARTPEEDTIKPYDDEREDEDYEGPDPASAEKGDSSDDDRT